MPGSSVLHCLHSLLKFMSTKSVMPSNHLILCRHLLLLSSIFPSLRVHFSLIIIVTFNYNIDYNNAPKVFWGSSPLHPISLTINIVPYTLLWYISYN